MPTNLDTLRAQPLSLIAPATQTLADGGSIGAWRREMEVAIRRSQTAAYIAAASERLGVSPKLFKGLSKVERAELNKMIATQLKYLDGFTADLRAGKLTMAQAQARAALYSGATRGTFYATRYPALTAVPGDGSTPCMGNCKCFLEEKGNKVYWRLSAAEHCAGCVAMAAGSPYGAEDDVADAAPVAAAPAQQADSLEDTDAKLRDAGLVTDTQMTDDERTSLQWYQGVGHDRINAELRGSTKIRDQYTLDRTTENLDSIMDRSKLDQEVTVYRGMYPETPQAEAEVARFQPGATVRDLGYVSTTASTDVAQRFGSDAVNISIRVPKDTPAIYMPTAAPLRMTSQGKQNEYELLLGRNLEYRVVSRTERDGGVDIELEVIP